MVVMIIVTVIVVIIVIDIMILSRILSILSPLLFSFCEVSKTHMGPSQLRHTVEEQQSDIFTTRAFFKRQTRGTHHTTRRTAQPPQLSEHVANNAFDVEY